MGEAHLHCEIGSIDNKIKGLAHGRRLVVANPTQPKTSESGSYGGVCAGVKKHLATSPVMGDSEKDDHELSSHRGLAARTLHITKTDVIAIGAYCRHGEFARTLKQVAEITRNGAQHFSLLADFNVAPKDIIESDLLETLDAVVVTPSGGSITCHQGRGSLIDFMIISRKLEPYIKAFEIVTDVPWSPHDGLLLRLDADCKTVRVRSFRKPKHFNRVELALLSRLALLSGLGLYSNGFLKVLNLRVLAPLSRLAFVIGA